MLTVGSLFSGIGGFDLGFERAGMRVVWQCEADPFCRSVLRHHWPDVTCFPDIREVKATDPIAVDVLCGGFPCQDISVAGRGEGIDGARSGLWGEYARLIRELRPRYVVVENVAALLARGMERVLGDLAACGYDAEWDCIPASALGAPHQRDRVWVVAYPSRTGCVSDGRSSRELSTREALTDAARGDGQGQVAHAGESRLEGGRHGGPVADRTREDDPWAVEPDVGRVAHGVPARVDRLRSLGNALIPQIAEWIGHRIVTDAASTERMAA